MVISDRLDWPVRDRVIRKQIIEGVKAYAEAYARFQKLQDDNADLLAIGDQKTGVIGEFFGLLYARSIHPSSKVIYADPSQTGWDLEVSGDNPGPDLRIQVKTVSEYSRTRAMTPLFPGWDLLYLVYLGRGLMPDGFWIVDNNGIFGGRASLTGLKMRKPDNPQSGSHSIPWGENRVSELMRLIE
jgi:hypothetical protein